jgi:hypothetical protein
MPRSSPRCVQQRDASARRHGPSTALGTLLATSTRLVVGHHGQNPSPSHRTLARPRAKSLSLRRTRGVSDDKRETPRLDEPQSSRRTLTSGPLCRWMRASSGRGTWRLDLVPSRSALAAGDHAALRGAAGLAPRRVPAAAPTRPTQQRASAKRCARTAPVPRSRGTPLAWSTSEARASGSPPNMLATTRGVATAVSAAAQR